MWNVKRDFGVSFIEILGQLILDLRKLDSGGNLPRDNMLLLPVGPRGRISILPLRPT